MAVLSTAVMSLSASIACWSVIQQASSHRSSNPQAARQDVHCDGAAIPSESLSCLCKHPKAPYYPKQPQSLGKPRGPREIRRSRKANLPPISSNFSPRSRKQPLERLKHPGAGPERRVHAEAASSASPPSSPVPLLHIAASPPWRHSIPELSDLVMAEQAAHDVVNSTQSVGASPLADVSGKLQTSYSFGGEEDGAAHPEHASRERASETTASTLSEPTHPAPDPESSNAAAHISSDERTGSNPPNKANAPMSNGTHPASEDTAHDVEWQRRDSSDPPARMTSRDRSNSFKKPTSFKAVSVTKNFLAKTVGTSPSPKLTVDKAPVASPSASFASSTLAKPRLVAKTGSNSRAAALSNTGSTGAPDPSKVWNRNRPVPPPPPKQFTDEELKQQYGIHLATRLQADEPAKGSNWADEDDEDDWAPETVEWMDGTKSTLQTTEEQKTHPETAEPGLPPHVPEKQEEHVEADVASSDGASRPGAPIGPGKTILRPGARSSVSLGKPGLVLRNVPEPALEAPKQGTPGPAKSPWAKLPPVDKVSPVTFSPSAHADAKHPPVSYRDYDTPPPSGPSPAREIAADTFERSWRDADRGSRELFDSKSGKYEPVRDKRRPSFRQEGGFRPPSVLQRPSQGRPSEGAEPSPSTRTLLSQDARLWDRRRSSNAVSEEASDSRKDMSLSPQSAKASVSDQAPTSTGPASAVAKTYSAHAPDNAPMQGQAPGGDANAKNANVHEMQQQLMRQRIEANRRRKEEEQAKEEVEKQERIRQKLLALGEPPKRHESASPMKPRADTPAASPETPTLPANPATSSEQRRTAESTLRAPPSAPLEPARHLDGLGEVPASLAKKPSSIAAPEMAARRQQGTEQATASQLTSTHVSASPSQTGPSPPMKPSSEPSDVAHMPPGQPKLLPETQRNFDRHQQWGRPNGGLAGPNNWNTNAPGAPGKLSAAVWGPPSRDKSLGNGAFESDMSRTPSINFPPQPSQHAPQPPPGPIAPPSASPKVNMPAGRSTDPSPPGGLGPARPEWTGQHTIPGYSQRPGFAGPTGPRHPFGLFNQAQPPGPVGAQWQSFGPRDRNFLESERHPMPNDSEATMHTPQRHGEVVGDRWVADRQRMMHSTPGSESLTPAMTPPMMGQVTPQHVVQSMAPGGPVAGAMRAGSRFFAVGADRPLQTWTPPGLATADEAAETQTGGMDTTLFDQNVARGYTEQQLVVRLPRPKPKVRLPSLQSPRAASAEVAPTPLSPYDGRPTGFGATTTVTMPMRTQPVRFGQQPIVAQAEWQNRFDMVTGRKATVPVPQQLPRQAPGPVSMPPRPQPMGVNTSTRPPIDMDVASREATVSLPQTVKAKDASYYSLPSHMAETKRGDDYLHGEPESGSRPTVLLPRAFPSPSWMSTGRSRIVASQRPSPVQAGIDAGYSFEVSSRVQIRLPGRPWTSKLMTRKSPYASPRAPKAARKPGQKREHAPERSETTKRPGAMANGMPKTADEGEEQKRRPRAAKHAGDGSNVSASDSASPSAREKKGGWARAPRGGKAPVPKPAARP